jgi:hypothetical protein
VKSDDEKKCKGFGNVVIRDETHQPCHSMQIQTPFINLYHILSIALKRIEAADENCSTVQQKKDVEGRRLRKPCPTV